MIHQFLRSTLFITLSSLSFFAFVACQSTDSKTETAPLVAAAPSPAINEKLTYTYAQMAMKDLDQVNALVLEQLRLSRSYDTDPEPLKKAVVFIFSRPNEDGTVEKVLSLVKSPLDDQDEWEPALEQLSTKAIESLKDPQGLSGKEQATYSVILMNILSELRPDLKKKGFEFDLANRIAQSNIVLSKECRAEQSLGQMRPQASPSEVAKKLVAPFIEKK